MDEGKLVRTAQHLYGLADDLYELRKERDRDFELVTILDKLIDRANRLSDDILHTLED